MRSFPLKIIWCLQDNFENRNGLISYLNMTISDIKIRFQTELTALYSRSEADELFSIICEHFLGLNKAEARMQPERDLSADQYQQFLESIAALKTGKPFQQVLGGTEFFGMKFFVDEHVLIPRPETEELLELAINKIQEKSTKNQVLDSAQTDSAQTLKFKILDIGTGSGIIPIVLKKHFPHAEIDAIDISNEALKIARRNAEFHQAEINLIQKDYLNENLDNVYDIIISNPPYIGIEESIEIEESVKGFEPSMALFSPTTDALIFYRKIAKDSKNHLSENGMVFLEINQKLGKETLELFRDFSESVLLKDISGNDRMIFVQK